MSAAARRADDLWALVHTQRLALVEDLAGVAADRWQVPSLCPGWSVHDVVAHLVDSALTTRSGFVVGLARAGFDFDRQNARGVRRHRGASPQQTLRRLREVSGRRSTPPVPLDSRLVEEVVHGQDVRRPLGLHRTYPQETVLRALRLQARTPASIGGAKKLLSGVRLTATDADLSLGEGAEIRGPAVSLLLAVCGRPVTGDLAGPGLVALPAG